GCIGPSDSKRKATRPAPVWRTTRARRTFAPVVSELDRHEMVDRDQHDQKEDTKTEAKADQLLLDRQQRLHFRGVDLISDNQRPPCDIPLSLLVEHDLIGKSCAHVS